MRMLVICKNKVLQINNKSAAQYEGKLIVSTMEYCCAILVNGDVNGAVCSCMLHFYCIMLKL